ncbi:hypothetical protein PBI_UNTOUCHABLE_2 [Gordonia phage Untouchable]|uniref:Phage protein n=2 Tax=Kenoshavirus TaxID=2842796 RepID=A0A649V9M5_9CAUD|nr:hypothetical protein HWC79_gp02 [Gordonia phage Untouchable]YP_009853865.1 hypothetical protein HWC81_gp02 [Gordonia phage Crocheter]QGJ89047.1 hypothetical protein PBI_UNTOUCHABLE_2 [Gordonia phage Untouchable]QGJ90348.1 hypothetical protein PBI_CROCHETER_2 [Gordonia phage Crocheter]
MIEIKNYTKKPVTIKAVQFKEGMESRDYHEIYVWIEENTDGTFDVNKLIEDPNYKCPSSGVSIDARDGRMVIASLEGLMWVDMNDWIIQGIKGEFYPCKPDIFEGSYDE